MGARQLARIYLDSSLDRQCHSRRFHGTEEKRVLNADKESTPGEMKGDMIGTIFRMTSNIRTKSSREERRYSE